MTKNELSKSNGRRLQLVATQALLVTRLEKLTKRIFSVENLALTFHLMSSFDWILRSISLGNLQWLLGERNRCLPNARTSQASPCVERIRNITKQSKESSMSVIWMKRLGYGTIFAGSERCEWFWSKIWERLAFYYWNSLAFDSTNSRQFSEIT